ncbi:MAG: hypothetical protein WD355_03845 [Balneolaceae bacterium]
MMKARTAALFISLFLMMVPLYGQSAEGDYMQIDYFYVQPEGLDQFMEQVQGFWLEVQKERFEENEITGWHLYRVRYQGNREKIYNFVSVTSATSLSAYEDLYGSAEPDPDSENGEGLMAWQLMKNIVHSELWRVRNSVLRDTSMSPSRFKVMDYMDVGLGREYEYRMFEDEVARPLHEERMNLNTMNAWELYELISPGGIRYGYNFATGNFYNNLANIEFGFTDELIRDSHPDVNMVEFFEAIFSTRDLVESSLWELVQFIE